MKKYLLLITLSMAAAGNAYAQDADRVVETLSLTCEICSMSPIAPTVCQSQLQKQVEEHCSAEGGNGEITGVQVTQKFAGGFCFDGTQGGRLTGTRNSVTFSCVTGLSAQ